MRVRLSELKKIIRSVVYECYGWPVDKEIPLYGVKSKSWGAENPVDPANKKLKAPKGSNTKSKKNLSEAFRKITSNELSEWSQGNYGYLQEDHDEGGMDEDDTLDMNEMDKDELDEMYEGDSSCSECGGTMEVNDMGEASCSECGGYLFIIS